MLISVPDEDVAEILGWLQQRDRRGARYFAAAIEKQLWDKQEVEAALVAGDVERLNILVQRLEPGYQRFRVMTWLYDHRV